MKTQEAKELAVAVMRIHGEKLHEDDLQNFASAEYFDGFSFYFMFRNERWKMDIRDVECRENIACLYEYDREEDGYRPRKIYLIGRVL